jgi:hypothetical protein
MNGSIARLIGVYDADGSVMAELMYFVRARLGRAHCALCDITHGRVRERADWRATREQLPVPFVTFHRDDQPQAVRRAAGAVLPVVLAESTDGALFVLVDRDGLAQCGGSPSRLVDAIQSAVTAVGLSWPARPRSQPEV